jgi:hypothetical protein
MLFPLEFRYAMCIEREVVRIPLKKRQDDLVNLILDLQRLRLVAFPNRYPHTVEIRNICLLFQCCDAHVFVLAITRSV